MGHDGFVYVSWTGDENSGTGPGAMALPAEVDAKRTVLCAESVQFEKVPHAFRITLVAPHRIGGWATGTAVDGEIEGCWW
jgi:hypothetical protein